MIEVKDCWLQRKCKKAAHCPDNFCIRLFKINELCDLALLTPSQRRYVKLRIDADGSDRDVFTQLSDIEKHIESFVSNGRSLYIHSSNVGNGKTSWSLRLLNSYIEHIWYKSDIKCRALFINVPRFLLALKNNISANDEYAQHIQDNIMNADLVVFDEIGTKSLTSFEFEHLLSIIDARINKGKANIYTSNLSGEELLKTVGSRLYSRIVNYSIDAELVGQDKRGLIA